MGLVKTNESKKYKKSISNYKKLFNYTPPHLAPGAPSGEGLTLAG